MDHVCRPRILQPSGDDDDNDDEQTGIGIEQMIERDRIYEEGMKKILRLYEEEIKKYQNLLENARSVIKEANHTIAMKNIELGEKPSTKESETIGLTKVEEKFDKPAAGNDKDEQTRPPNFMTKDTASKIITKDDHPTLPKQTVIGPSAKSPPKTKKIVNIQAEETTIESDMESTNTIEGYESEENTGIESNDEAITSDDEENLPRNKGNKTIRHNQNPRKISY